MMVLLALASPVSVHAQGISLSSKFDFQFEVIGPKVDYQDFPWQVGVVAGGLPGCGGILVSPSYILTAAHCVDNWGSWPDSARNLVPFADIKVYRSSAGFAAGEPLPLDKGFGVVIHDRYKEPGGINFQFDVALLRLREELPNAVPAPLSTKVVNSGQAVVSGWGFDGSGGFGVLRASELKVVSNDTCRANISNNQQAIVTQATICTFDAEASPCNRDSGGPLVMGSASRPKTIGVLSWTDQYNCGEPWAGTSLLAGYTRASAIADWVKTVTGDPRTVTSEAFGDLLKVKPITGFDFFGGIRR